jgi:hypothetical protein
MRILLFAFLVACAPPEPEPCGCDETSKVRCPTVSPEELEALRGEVGPGWETCPPAVPTTP